MSSHRHPSLPEPIIGRRGKLNIPQMPELRGLHGRVQRASGRVFRCHSMRDGVRVERAA